MCVLRSLTLLLFMAVTSVASAEAASRVFVIHGIPGVPVDVYASAAGQPVPVDGHDPLVPAETDCGGASRARSFRHPHFCTRCEPPVGDAGHRGAWRHDSG